MQTAVREDQKGDISIIFRN